MGKQSAEHIAKRIASRSASMLVRRPLNIWAKVEQGNAHECWPWTGSVGNSGYGRTEIAGKSYQVHRIVFNLFNPGGISLKGDRVGREHILHSCDNKICCNPAHLRVGTQKENMEDRKRRNREAKWKPGQHPFCKLTLEQAQEIRKLRTEGITGRELAKRYNVSPQTISAVNVGRFYRV